MTEHPIRDRQFWDDFASTAYESVGHRFTAHFAERALDLAALPAGAHVLDIATGTGALAIAASHRGLRVLATDFSAGMVGRVRACRLPGLDARQMDGQALDLPDASFDAAFSMFGIMLFPDWRAGLAEMARVVRPGGLGVLGTWVHKHGAATSLLLAEVCKELFPRVETPPIPGMAEWREPSRFEASLARAGFTDITIDDVRHDFLVDAAQLADPDTWFGFSPLWPLLDAGQRLTALAYIRSMMPASGEPLPVPSTALIAAGRRMGT